jgi:hypothetical protein
VGQPWMPLRASEDLDADSAGKFQAATKKFRTGSFDETLTRKSLLCGPASMFRA